MNLTCDEILNMPAGREMDDFMAENVMGWRIHPHETHYVTPHNHFVACGNFEPSTDIAAAWEVQDKLGGAYIDTSYRGVVRCTFFKRGSRDIAGFSEAETAPLAICRAALLAVMDGEK